MCSEPSDKFIQLTFSLDFTLMTYVQIFRRRFDLANALSCQARAVRPPLWKSMSLLPNMTRVPPVLKYSREAGSTSARHSMLW